MINMTIMGGLGNQLFQWACARNLQEKYGHYIEYDYSFYSGQAWRSLHLDDFKNIILNKVDVNYTLGNARINDGFNYDNFIRYDLTQTQRKYHLYGYWQSEKYFKENEDIIRNNLDIDSDTKYYINNKYPFLDNEKVVSIHIRRTDYVTSNGYHPVQTISYYEQALDQLEYDKVLVFSDDIPWCKQTLKFNNMVFAEDNTNVQDLYIMSMCDDNVVANSSFSWWAAWLNKNVNKKIIAPSKWFGVGAPSYADIVPESWIKI